MKVRGSGGITTTIRQTLDRVVVQDEVGLELNLVILDTQCPLLGTLHTYAGQGTADWGQHIPSDSRSVSSKCNHTITQYLQPMAKEII